MSIYEADPPRRPTPHPLPEGRGCAQQPLLPAPPVWRAHRRELGGQRRRGSPSLQGGGRGVGQKTPNPRPRDRGRLSPRTVRVTVVRFPADNTRGTRSGLVLYYHELTSGPKS